MRVDGMARREQSLGDHPPLAEAAAGGANRAPEDEAVYWTIHAKMTERGCTCNVNPSVLP